jgi:GNAT superfamily N-acetyltransferase
MTFPLDPDELSICVATDADADTLFALRCRAAEDLTAKHGMGHWSATGTVHGMRRTIGTTRTLVARRSGEAVGALSLQTKKPWSIHLAYFTAVERALYLIDMRVDPQFQGQGVGRRLIDAAVAAARVWPADAIRLDAYDAAAGAGAFYAKCGFVAVGHAVYRTVPLIYFERRL